MDKRVILNRMRRNPLFVVGSIAAVVVVVLLVFGPALLHFDPEANSLSERFLPPEGFANGLDGHILGTDQLGRDVLIRLLIGGRYSLAIAFAVVALQVVVARSWASWQAISAGSWTRSSCVPARCSWPFPT